MSKMRSCQLIAAFVSCCGIVMPLPAAVAVDNTGHAQADQPSPAEVEYVDYSLDGEGRLRGVVVDAQGQAIADCPLVLVRENRAVGRATSDAEGRFALEAGNGGICLLATHNQALPCRLWTPRTAPPAAASQAMLVVGDVDRGQWPASPLCSFLLSDPIILGLVIAGAIAIPIAIDSDDSSGS